MVVPDRNMIEVLKQPTTLVNRFRDKKPHADSPHYIYLPGNSFQWPGEHALVNVDIPPSKYANPGIDLDTLPYILDRPEFVAWPVDKTTIDLGEGASVPLSELFVRKPPGNVPGRRLSFANDATGPGYPDLPGFRAPTSDPRIDFVRPIYEHDGGDGSGGSAFHKYLYDLIPDAHDGWGAGAVRFWAAPAEQLLTDLSQYAAAQSRRPPTTGDLASDDTLGKLNNATRGLLEPGKTVDQTMSDNLVAVFTGQGLPVKVFTTSLSVDAGFLISGAIERGVVWNLAREPIHTYTTWSGGIMIGAGASVNPLNVGVWWGATEQAVLDAMQGFGLYQVIGATYGLGLNIILSCTADFLVYGLTISPTAGVEVEVGGGLGATYTSFYDVTSDTPGSMVMPLSVPR